MDYGGFSLVPVDKQLENFDPTWERDVLNWLRPIQRRFWDQLKKLNPETYVLMGDRNIIVSKKVRLLETLRKNAF